MLRTVLKVIDRELDRCSIDNYPHHLYLSDNFVFYSYCNQGLQDLRDYIINWCDCNGDHLNVYDAIQEYIDECNQNACNAKSPDINYMWSCYHDEAFYVLYELLPYIYHQQRKQIEGES